MNIRPYQYIRAIYEEGSLLAAASRLGISQPALSHFLSSVEAEAGQRLFERNNRGLVPTGAGWIYIRAADEIERVKAQTYGNIRRLSGEVNKGLIIGSTPHRGIEIYSGLYKIFTAIYPQIQLTLREAYMSRLLDMLKDGKIDLMLGSSSDFRQKECRFLRFFREEVVLAISEKHPLAAKAGRPQDLRPVLEDLREVEDVPFVISGQGSAIRRISDSVFEAHGISPTVIFETDNIPLRSGMISSNQCIGFLPATYVYRDTSLRCFSMSPKVYIYSGMYHLNEKSLNRYERHLIYLAYQYSRSIRLNERFLDYPDPAVLDIIKEFSGGEDGA